MKGSKTFLGEVRGLGHECALSLGWCCTPLRLPLSAHPGGRWKGEGPAPSQEALGVGRACGNDFIGKACDIFSPPVCGSWRKLEVVVISVSLAAVSRSRIEQRHSAELARQSCLGSPAMPGARAPVSAFLAHLHLRTSSCPPLHPLQNLSGPSVCRVLSGVFFFEKTF